MLKGNAEYISRNMQGGCECIKSMYYIADLLLRDTKYGI